MNPLPLNSKGSLSFILLFDAREGIKLFGDTMLSLLQGTHFLPWYLHVLQPAGKFHSREANHFTCYHYWSSHIRDVRARPGTPHTDIDKKKDKSLKGTKSMCLTCHLHGMTRGDALSPCRQVWGCKSSLTGKLVFLQVKFTQIQYSVNSFSSCKHKCKKAGASQQ